MLVVAHRGYSARFPENTTLAFERAIAAGADLIETDLRLTLDGAAVCSHDADLARVAGIPMAVAESTLAALKAVALPDGQTLLTLPEVLALACGRARVMLDVKVDTDAMRAAIVGAVRAAGMERDVVYGVRTAEHLHALRALDAPFAFVAMPPRPELLHGFIGGGIRAARLWDEDATAPEIARVHAARLEAWVTAGRRPAGEAPGHVTTERLEALLAMGADAVLVNDVELAVRARRARQPAT